MLVFILWEIVNPCSYYSNPHTDPGSWRQCESQQCLSCCSANWISQQEDCASTCRSQPMSFSSCFLPLYCWGGRGGAWGSVMVEWCGGHLAATTPHKAILKLVVSWSFFLTTLWTFTGWAVANHWSWLLPVGNPAGMTPCFSVPQQTVPLTHTTYRQVCLWIYRWWKRGKQGGWDPSILLSLLFFYHLQHQRAVQENPVKAERSSLLNPSFPLVQKAAVFTPYWARAWSIALCSDALGSDPI